MKIKTITTIKFIEVHDAKDLKDECKSMSTEQLKNYVWGLRENLAEDVRRELVCDEAEVLSIDVEKVEE